jgi:hypothetical protein
VATIGDVFDVETQIDPQNCVQYAIEAGNGHGLHKLTRRNVRSMRP